MTDGKDSNDLCTGLAAYRGRNPRWRVKFKARGLGGSSEGRRSGGGSIEMHYPSREQARTLGAGSVTRTLHTTQSLNCIARSAAGAAISPLVAAATTRTCRATVWVRGWWRRAAVPRIGILRKMTGFVGCAVSGGGRAAVKYHALRPTAAQWRVWPIFLE